MRPVMQILMIVGSESGNAQMVGDCVREELEKQGHEVEVFAEGGLEDARLGEREVVLAITSTTGLGDLPQNVTRLYEELVAQRPDLSRVRYGLIGMGDRNYKDTFWGGPKKLDAILGELGAKRVGEPLVLDATDNPMPDEDAVAWTPGWLDQL
ncbi:MAG: flavodoxin domain-containing protein [Sandaracinaceae bacterium]|nr:flavodoxin domain-containing protein [Sandaracinaceae bacterium]